jgi:hypothetical protein
MGKHRRVSVVPSSLSAANAGASSSEVRGFPATLGAGGSTVVNRVSQLTAASKHTNCWSRYAWGVAESKPASSFFPSIGRCRVGGNSIHWSAVKEATGQAPSPVAWSPGRRGRGPLAAAPELLCRCLRTAKGAILGQGGIPMSQTAPAVGASPARRLERLAGEGCSSIESIPGTLLTPWDGLVARRRTASESFREPAALGGRPNPPGLAIKLRIQTQQKPAGPYQQLPASQATVGSHQPTLRS